MSLVPGYAENDRDRLTPPSTDEHARPKRGDRRVVAAENLTETELELIARAEVPPEYAHLDAGLADWRL